jgi:hypothetical protein
MLTKEDRRTFDEQGFVRIRGAFSAADAKAMEQRVWAELRKKYGARSEAPETWNLAHATGLQSLRKVRIFDAIGSPRTREAFDDILGKGRWKEPSHWGQFLVTFPSAERRWTLPASGWHTDFAYTDLYDGLFGLLMFSFICDLPPMSGGTMLIAGSHRLVRRFVRANPALCRPGRADGGGTRSAPRRRRCS